MAKASSKQEAQRLELKRRLGDVPAKLALAHRDLLAFAKCDSHEVSRAAQESIAAVCDLLEVVTKDVCVALNSPWWSEVDNRGR